MSWQDLLQGDPEIVTCAWLGGRELRTSIRAWTIEGRLPQEYGWYMFLALGRSARYHSVAELPGKLFGRLFTGYLVGDRFVQDDARVDPDPDKIFAQSEQVHLIEPGDRFARVSASRAWERGPLIYVSPEIPVGPEPEVLDAYLNRLPSVAGIKGVSPALDAAFRLESRQREEVERRRAEVERQRQADVERRRAEGLVGTGAGRRELALTDFAAAAKAALRISGAEYLDHRVSSRTEMAVTYRLGARRFRCICDSRTLRIVDAGICLKANGEVGDTKFTLESLPAVVLDAERLGVLHVYNHFDDEGEERDDYDD